MKPIDFEVTIPADVPLSYEQDFVDNYEAITHNTGKLMLFACDQKIEHLNKDFFGANIPPQVADPRHLFSIAKQGKVGAMAVHPGLFSRYAHDYPDINYIIKLNGKTDLIPTDLYDPRSFALLDVPQIIELKEESDLNIRGIGYTIYLGSKYEAEMLSYASKAIYQAHQHGLVCILWIYPRGKAITNDQSIDLIAGAAGVANALGADFVKVKAPLATAQQTSAELLTLASQAAGNTKVICSGSTIQEPSKFLKELKDQMTIGNAGGGATGRNIFQRPLPDAIGMTYAISAIVCDNASVDDALKLYHEHSRA